MMTVSAVTALVLLVNIGVTVSNIDEQKDQGLLGYDLTRRLWHVLENIHNENNPEYQQQDIIDQKSVDTAPAIPGDTQEPDTEGIPQKLTDEDTSTEPQRQVVMSRATSYNSVRQVSNDVVSSYKRGSSSWPYSYGVNLDNIGGTHPAGSMREGQATDSDTCHYVRKVPDSLREPTAMYKNGINTFYQKYTETYGIPIVGSANVTDEGLMRACYAVRMLLASRYDVRNAVYKFYGMIALIGDGEEQTTLPEYSHLDPSHWNSRVRGLGPTITTPMSSAGDDNQRCKGGERYWDQDILVHEFSHHVEQIGATYTIAGFKKRLYDIFTDVVTVRGKWGNEYAAKNMHEYFATASQFYFNSFQHSGKYKRLFNVTDHTSLRNYDPDITELLDEVHPCVAHENNKFVHRCDWNSCDSSAFELVLNDSFVAKSICPQLKNSSNIASLDACAAMACYYKANVFNWKGSKCRVLKCDATKTYQDMALVQGKGSFNIYKIKGDLEPQMDLSKEFSHSYKSHCLKGPNTKAAECKVSKKSRVKCGWPGVGKKQCKTLGCCFSKRKCFHPVQACADSHQMCPERAKMGFCTTNPGYMYRKCPLACNICEQLGDLVQGELEEMCQDKNIYCPDWAKAGECTNNEGWMLKNCALSCKACTVESDPLAKYLQ